MKVYKRKGKTENSASAQVITMTIGRSSKTELEDSNRLLSGIGISHFPYSDNSSKADKHDTDNESTNIKRAAISKGGQAETYTDSGVLGV